MTITIKTFATVTIATLTMLHGAQIARAADNQTAPPPPAAQKSKMKQCVMFYSPQYKKVRIKPIEISFRWCSKKDPTDCTKWENDTIADKGKPFTIAAYCFTHTTAVKMDLRYNRRFGANESTVRTQVEPHAMALQGDLAPHPFCATKAAQRFVMNRKGASLKSGRPRDAIAPKCVWSPIKQKAKPAS